MSFPACFQRSLLTISLFFSSQEKVPTEIREKLMNGILRPQGPQLIKTLITASVFSLSTCSLPHVAGVLLEFMQVDRQVTKRNNIYIF